MRQSLDLLLDPDADAAVRADWAALDAAGLPSAGQHQGPSNAPHVTLAERDEVGERTERGLDRLAAALPVQLPLGGLLLFPAARGRAVLARAVVVSERLLRLHAAAAGLLGPGGPPWGRPGAWVPHVTLARRLTPDQVARAVAVLTERAPAPAPVLEARGVLLQRWDPGTRTTRVLGERDQSGSSGSQNASRMATPPDGRSGVPSSA